MEQCDYARRQTAEIVGDISRLMFIASINLHIRCICITQVRKSRGAGNGSGAAPGLPFQIFYPVCFLLNFSSSHRWYPASQAAHFSVGVKFAFFRLAEQKPSRAHKVVLDYCRIYPFIHICHIFKKFLNLYFLY